MALVDATTGQVVENRGRGRRPGIPAKERAAIPLDEFKVTVVAEDNRAEFKRRRDDRSDEQTKVDGLIKDMYRAWIEAGSPVVWADLPIRTWTIATEHAENALFLLRKAARFLDRKLWFGNIEEKQIDGKKVTVIPFGVTSIEARMKNKPSNREN